jgi:hypothetical protein
MAVFSRIREIGGRIVRLTDSSVAIRFGFGVCGSISETVSTVGLVGASGAIGAGFGGCFFAAIGAKADLVGITAGLLGAISGCSARLVAACPSTLGATPLFSVVLDALEGLTAARERVDDDLAGTADFGVFSALDLVVVFVGI